MEHKDTPAVALYGAVLTLLTGASLTFLAGYAHLRALAGTTGADVLPWLVPTSAFFEAGAGLLTAAPLLGGAFVICGTGALALTVGAAPRLLSRPGGGIAASDVAPMLLLPAGLGAVAVLALLALPVGEATEGSVSVSAGLARGGEAVSGELVAHEDGLWVLRTADEGLLVVPDASSKVVLEHQRS